MGQCVEREAIISDAETIVTVTTGDMVRRSTSGDLLNFNLADGVRNNTDATSSSVPYSIVLGGGYDWQTTRCGGKNDTLDAINDELECKLFLFIIYVCIFGAMVSIGVIGNLNYR